MLRSASQGVVAGGKASGMAKPIRRKEPDTSGEVWIHIQSYKRKYFISLADHGANDRSSDEAQLRIMGMIRAISPALKKHMGYSIEVSLLCAQSYTAHNTSTTLFGSLTFRGSQRSALAYLPPQPFWHLPSVIERGSSWLSLSWKSIYRGHATLNSIYLGDDGDFDDFADSCVRAGPSVPAD